MIASRYCHVPKVTEDSKEDTEIYNCVEILPKATLSFPARLLVPILTPWCKEALSEDSVTHKRESG